MATESKRTPVITADVIDGNLILSFANGERLEIDPGELSSTIRDEALLHGLKQKLVDAAAIARNPDTGASATAQDKYDAVREIYGRITSPDGTWNKIRAGGDGGAGSGLLLRALMKMSGKSRAEIEAFLASKSKEERAALKADPKVAGVIAEMQRSAQKVDTTAMLAGILG